MRLGILEAVGLVASLVFAVPVGVAGGQFLLDGRTTLGATLVVVAVLMVLVPRYVVAPQDLPGEVAARVVGRTVTESGSADDEGPGGTDPADADDR